MVMTLHKLTAGTGYDYLTRQVAAMDSTEKGHASLADYYDQKGESPGHWLGSGLAGIDGLEAGDIVTADQMLSLFGLGDHPLATERLAALTRATDRDIRDAMQLGQRYGIYSGMTDFSVELTQRISDWNTTHGRAASDPVPADVRAELRSEVGREAFRKRFGREPLDARELSGFIVRAQRPVRSGVSGYDATFSPVKSVSALWALADPRTSAVIQRCHNRAVADSLRYLEDKAIYTRRGRNGVRQVKTRGIIAAAFTHRDSRAGDPDLHTHVAIANKVQAADDGAWLAIAPAGAGKTTAMNTLGAAWREAGGEVLGTAPSAAAAAALGEQLGGHADTLHILTHGLSTGRLPGWAEQIGPRTLVVIDEAGMADTLTLEAAVSFVVGRGGSVRLVGDDHQLAAVQAGGVLKDLAAKHGAVQLTEVVRFADPAEAAASLDCGRDVRTRSASTSTKAASISGTRARRWTGRSSRGRPTGRPGWTL